jgi:thiol:disulfide interchange protein/DsbC/DsbD-like thiol-disulfide interchange protein
MPKLPKTLFSPKLFSSKRICLVFLILSAWLLTGLPSRAEALAEPFHEIASETSAATEGSISSYLNPDQSLAVSLSASAKPLELGQEWVLDLIFDIRSKGYIYWKNPGSTGLGTDIEWILPEGFLLRSVSWPLPEIFVKEASIAYGYKNQLHITAQISPPSVFEETSFTIGTKLSWLLCDEDCLAEDAYLELDIPIEPSAEAPQLLAANEAKPTLDPKEPIAGQNLDNQLVSLQAQIENDQLLLDILPKKELSLQPKQLYFFPLVPWIKPVDPKDLKIRLLEARDAATPTAYRLVMPLDLSQLQGADYESAELEATEASLGRKYTPIETRLQGLLRLDSRLSCTVDIPLHTSSVQTPLATSASMAKKSHLLWMLSLAFIGGIVLNVMPCVFPVLGLKILSFMQDREGTSLKVKLQGLSFAAGIVCSFWVLAGLLFVLRSGGEALGWGFQLQSPVFVFLLIALFFVLGLNFLNVFQWGTSLMALGTKPGQTQSLLSSFLGGVLACVVAAPCSGPFMGTALGVAITQASGISFLIFTALGLGLALPYVLLSFRPSLLGFLPKAGAWMESLKEAMAFPLFGSVLWLLWVLGQQRSLALVIQVLWILLFISIGCWAYGRWWMLSSKKSLRLFLFPLWLLAALAVGVKALHTPQDAQEAAPTWLPYSEKLLESLLSQGKPVFIDFTAGWCLTCQINKHRVLDTESAQKAFQNKDVTLLRADWTHKDPAIAKKLESLGRSGVPFNVLYTQNQDEPLWAFPTLLSLETLEEGLRHVKSP